jgi:hypothetical protein
LFGIRYNLSAPRRKQKKQRPGEYRHIKVIDKIDAVNKIRSLTVECPLEYPGMTERERRRMYEGLAMIGDAFRDADERCQLNHERNK